ncbi:unnamed protein product [Rhizoctonia solani]|uniref:Jacalin-type lectin domain-containing protein n=1 Tax=Rhizoctonia solani TaxID=456999 RepID=A0A8H2WX54_9AGAM|nr:unnamed protein product [Rhizoctonia solani]
MLHRLVSLLAACALCLAIRLCPETSKWPPGLVQSNMWGGTGGTLFNDLCEISASPKLESITLKGEERLDSVSLTTSGKTFTHGGQGGKTSFLKLDKGEHITSIELCWKERNGADRIYYMRATTDGKQIKSVEAGMRTKHCEMIPTKKEETRKYALVGLQGRAGKEIDKLGFYMVPIH